MEKSSFLLVILYRSIRILVNKRLGRDESKAEAKLGGSDEAVGALINCQGRHTKDSIENSQFPIAVQATLRGHPYCNLLLLMVWVPSVGTVANA